MEQSLAGWLLPVVALIVGVVIGFLLARLLPGAAPGSRPTQDRRDAGALRGLPERGDQSLQRHRQPGAEAQPKLNIQERLFRGRQSPGTRRVDPPAADRRPQRRRPAGRASACRATSAAPSRRKTTPPASPAYSATSRWSSTADAISATRQKPCNCQAFACLAAALPQKRQGPGIAPGPCSSDGCGSDRAAAAQQRQHLGHALLHRGGLGVDHQIGIQRHVVRGRTTARGCCPRRRRTGPAGHARGRPAARPARRR